MAEFTPMMQHYLQTKEEYKDCILFYRLGDFYEMFFDDAVLVSKELELTLTGKSCGMEERAPMCGIPYHAVEGYLNRLVANGHKVAICEQVEDPKLAKGIVKREVIRVVTPGTNMDIQALDESKNNYIMCIVYLADKYGISLADVSTGDYYVTEVDSERKLIDEINKFAPSEIVCNESFYMSGVDLEDMRHRLGITIYSLDAWYFSDETAETTLKVKLPKDKYTSRMGSAYLMPNGNLLQCSSKTGSILITDQSGKVLWESRMAHAPYRALYVSADLFKNYFTEIK